jgi:uncharacterized RDD family membrane protein YckC
VTEVVTGEAVVLDVPCARFPSRIAAVLIDLLVQIVIIVLILTAILQLVGNVNAATGAGIFLSTYVVIVVGYSAIFETASRGKTLGKMAFGLRVVSDDGGPIRFRQALVRALTGAIEIWTPIGAPIGLITSIVSAKGKRLGDMFAGTYVIQERAPHRAPLPLMFATVPPPLLGWAQVAETSRLSDQSAEAAGSYLRRFHELTPAARDDLGLRIATAVLAQVSPAPPVGTPPAAYLAAVLAIRRYREHLRLASQPAMPPRDGTGPPPAGAWIGPDAPPGGAGWAPPGTTPPAAPAPGAPGGGHADRAAATATADPARTAVSWPEPGHPEPAQPAHGGFAPPG